ncbi:MAG: hypothetical protein H0V37_05305 [Chloroflexia bacterium]|nr:hypothetical protein [Chloroflexia bacterium]
MITPTSIAVLVIVLVTLGLMLLRPGHLAEGWYALAGAVATLLAGAVAPAEVPSLILETGDVLLFLLGMLALTGIIERARLFDIIADLCAQWSGGNGRLLFLFLYLFGAFVTTFLSLDVTVILLTPIVLALTARRNIDPVPFLFATVFVANVVSLALPVSNLTNLLVYDGLGIEFRDFAATMWWPNLVAAISCLGMLFWLFGKRIPRRFGPPLPDLAPVSVATPWTAFCGIVLALTLVTLVVLGGLGYPLWWASISGSAALALGAATRRRLTVAEIWRDLSPPVFLFLIGMTIVVAGFDRAWLDDRTVPLPANDAAALALAAGLNALGSNVVNNVPMTLLSLGVIERAPGAARELLTYGSLVGANIGPALTTYGSLATILWLTLCRRAGVRITTRDYLRVSLAVVPVTLIVTTAVLHVTLR